MLETAVAAAKRPSPHQQQPPCVWVITYGRCAKQSMRFVGGVKGGLHCKPYTNLEAAQATQCGNNTFQVWALLLLKLKERTHSDS